MSLQKIESILADEQQPNLMPNSELPNPMIGPSAGDQFPMDQSPQPNGPFPPNQLPQGGQFPQTGEMPFPSGQFPNQSINPPADGLQNPNQQFNENGEGDGQNQMNFGSDEIQSEWKK